MDNADSETSLGWRRILRPVTRADILNVSIVILATFATWAPRSSGILDLRWDASVYYILGTSLAEGDGYRLLCEPGRIDAIQYPPLLPALVAVHERAMGTSDPARVGRALRVTFFAMSLAYAVAAYGLVRRFVSAPRALPIALIPCVGFASVFASDLLFAELPFSLASTLFLAFHRRRSGPARMLALALLAATAFLLRTAGIALLAAWVLEAALNREWRQMAIRAALAVLPVLAWQAHVGRVRAGDAYANPAYSYQRAPYQFYNVSYAENLMMVNSFVPELGHASPTMLARRCLGNLVNMPTYLGESIVGGRNLRMDLEKRPFRLGLIPAWAVVHIATILGFMVIAGLGVMAARREWLIPGYVTLSAAVVATTPWPGQFMRYLTPLTPILALALHQCLKSMSDRFDRRWGGTRSSLASTALTLFLWLIVARNAYTTAKILQGRHDDGIPRATLWGGDADRLIFFDRGWAAFDDAVSWVRDHTPKEAVITSTTPAWIYLRAGRLAVMPPMETDVERIQELLDDVPVDYAIVDNLNHTDLVQRFVLGPIERYPDRWSLVYTAPEGRARVFRRVGVRPSRSSRQGPVPG